MADHISFRPITTDDLEFLFRLYASTREEELAVTDWTPAEKEAFLRMQFHAQHKHYMENYDGAEYSILLCNGTPAGRLYLLVSRVEIRIIDVSLLPEFRGRFIGTNLLGNIQRLGKQKGLPVTIHVERLNPALRLYHRLGFRQTEERGFYYRMEWRSSGEG